MVSEEPCSPVGLPPRRLGAIQERRVPAPLSATLPGSSLAAAGPYQESSRPVTPAHPAGLEDLRAPEAPALLRELAEDQGSKSVQSSLPYR